MPAHMGARAMLLLMGIALASAFSCGPILPVRKPTARKSASLRMTKEAPAMVEVAQEAAPTQQPRRLGTRKQESIYTPRQEKQGKFPTNFLSPARTSTSSKQPSWDAEEAAKAKTSALILAAALFFAQPLSLAGYYTMQGFGYGKVNTIPRLCTATAFICEERENNARIRAEKEQIENEQWQQKFKGPMGLADSDSANDPGSNTWWGQRAVYKSGRPKAPLSQAPISSPYYPSPATARAKLAKEAQEKKERFEKTVTEETARSIAATDAKLKDSLKINGQMLKDKRLAEEKKVAEAKAKADEEKKKKAAEAKAKADEEKKKKA